MKDMLLQDVKNHLRITWDDEDQDILKIIERSKAYLQKLYGSVPLSFDEENPTKELLLNRCRYERSNSLHDFEKTYKSLLGSFRDEGALKARRVQNETIQ